MQASSNQETDDMATAKKVTNFLDKNLDHYLALSGKQRYDLKSPTLDGMPKKPINGNSNENRMLNIYIAEQVIACVGLAMQNSTRESQKILLGRYVDQMLNYNIAQELSVSSSTYSRKQEKALCEFADRFEFQVVKHGLLDEVADLHVYKR